MYRLRRNIGVGARKLLSSDLKKLDIVVRILSSFQSCSNVKKFQTFVNDMGLNSGDHLKLDTKHLKAYYDTIWSACKESKIKAVISHDSR